MAAVPAPSSADVNEKKNCSRSIDGSAQPSERDERQGHERSRDAVRRIHAIDALHGVAEERIAHLDRPIVDQIVGDIESVLAVDDVDASRSRRRYTRPQRPKRRPAPSSGGSCATRRRLS